MTLYFGGLTFQITPEGRGHSTGDLTVYIPQKRVLLMGDLLDTEIHPGQGESAGVFYSNVKGWIKVLDNIMARNSPLKLTFPVMVRRISAAASKIWRSRNATSW